MSKFKLFGDWKRRKHLKLEDLQIEAYLNYFLKIIID